MADILVVEKPKAQRAVESAAILVLPPLTGWALWRNSGPSPFIALAVVVVFFAIPTLGNVAAGALSSERITVQERVRRTTLRLFRPPVWLRVSYLFVAYLDLMLSSTLPLLPREEIAARLGRFVLLAAASAAVVTVAMVLQYRRRYAAYLAAEGAAAPAPPAYTPGEWLSKTLPMHYAIWGAALLGAYLAAQRLDDETMRSVVMACGAWSAFLVRAVLSLLARDRRPPVLWTQFGFGMAVLAAFLVWGIPFALFCWLLARLRYVEGTGLGLAATGGALFGTISMLAMWGLAKLSVFDPRRAR